MKIHLTIGRCCDTLKQLKTASRVSTLTLAQSRDSGSYVFDRDF